MREGREQQQNDKIPGQEMVHGRSTLLVLDLRKTNFDHLLEQSIRKRFIHREMDGALGSREIIQVFLAGFDDRSSRKQAAMIRKCGEPHQRTLVFENRHAVADAFHSFRRDRGTDSCANSVQGGAGGLGDGGQILIDGLGSGAGS